MTLNRIALAINFALMIALTVTLLQQRQLSGVNHHLTDNQQTGAAPDIVAAIKTEQTLASSPLTTPPSGVTACEQSLPQFIQAKLIEWQLTPERLTEAQWQWLLNAEAIQRYSDLQLSLRGTLLEYLIYYHSYEQIDWLLNHGLSLNRRASTNRYPLVYAAMFGKFEDFEYLINAGADIAIAQQDGPATFKTYISFNPSRAEQEKMFAYLEQAGYPQRDQYDKLVSQLLNIDASSDLSDLLDGVDVQRLDLGEQSLLGQLLVSGITNKQFNQISSDQLAVLAQHPQVLFDIANGMRSELALVESIIAAGADVNQPNGSGFTPLMYASMNVNPQMVKILLEQGADASLVNINGATAASLIPKDHPEIQNVFRVEALLQNY